MKEEEERVRLQGAEEPTAGPGEKRLRSQSGPSTLVGSNIGHTAVAAALATL